MKRIIKDEKGQALILVLILMLVGSLIITPLLGFMGTGLMAAQTFESRMDELYAADAGIEDGLWKIKNDQIPVGSYPLTVNGKDVTVDIGEIWLLEGMESDARGTAPHSELVATGRLNNPATGQYEVRVTYDGTNGNVFVERIGVWLPIGFGYNGSPSGITTDPPVIGSLRGGTTVIWDLTPRLKLNQGVVTTISQFFYITPVGVDPVGDFAWVRTTRMDMYLSWDADFVTYTVTATATSTSGRQTEVFANVAREIGAVPYSVGIVTWEVSLQ